MRKSKRILDSIDKKILQHLGINARMSNREIAIALGLSEGTIRNRVKALQDEKAVKIMAIVDVRLKKGLQTPTMAYLGIHADINHLSKIAEQISRLHFVRFVATMLGRYEILVISYFNSNDELIDCVNNEIMSIQGVRHVETNLAIKNLKYDYRWGSII